MYPLIKCGEWDLNPRIPEEQGYRSFLAHSKLRTILLIDLRLWPGLAIPARHVLWLDNESYLYFNLIIFMIMEDKTTIATTNRRLFGTNGVRGIYGKDFTLDLVMDLTYSISIIF